MLLRATKHLRGLFCWNKIKGFEVVADNDDTMISRLVRRSLG